MICCVSVATRHPTHGKRGSPSLGLEAAYAITSWRTSSIAAAEARIARRDVVHRRSANTKSTSDAEATGMIHSAYHLSRLGRCGSPATQRHAKHPAERGGGLTAFGSSKDWQGGAVSLAPAGVMHFNVGPTSRLLMRAAVVRSWSARQGCCRSRVA